jgi:hypothetical protein
MDGQDVSVILCMLAVADGIVVNVCFTLLKRENVT